MLFINVSSLRIFPAAVDFFMSKISFTIESKIMRKQPVGVGGEVCLVSSLRALDQVWLTSHHQPSVIYKTD